MAEILWPDAPFYGQIYTSDNGDSWVWNSYAWDSLGSSGGCCGIVAIAESAFKTLYSTGGLSTGQKYRIWDAGVASGAPGNTTGIDDGYSGFVTTAITGSSYEVGGAWHFYSNNKTRTYFAFQFDDSVTTQSSVTSLTIGGTELLDSTVNYSGTNGADPAGAIATFRSDIEASILAGSTDWVCTKSAAGVTTDTNVSIKGWCVVYLEAAVPSSATNSLGLSATVTYEDAAGMVVNYPDTSGVSGNDSELVLLDAEYSILIEGGDIIEDPTFSSAYEPNSNLLVTHGNIHTSDNAIYAMPWGMKGLSPYVNCRFLNISSDCDRDDHMISYGTMLTMDDTTISASDFRISNLAVRDSFSIIKTTISDSVFLYDKSYIDTAVIENMTLSIGSEINADYTFTERTPFEGPLDNSSIIIEFSLITEESTINIPCYNVNPSGTYSYEGLNISGSTMYSSSITVGKDSWWSTNSYYGINLVKSTISFDSWNYWDKAGDVICDNVIMNNASITFDNNQLSTTQLKFNTSSASYINTTIEINDNEYPTYTSSEFDGACEIILQESTWVNSQVNMSTCDWTNAEAGFVTRRLFYSAGKEGKHISSFNQCQLTLTECGFGKTTSEFFLNSTVSFAGCDWASSKFYGDGMKFWTTGDAGKDNEYVGGCIWFNFKSKDGVYDLTEIHLGDFTGGLALPSDYTIIFENCYFENTTFSFSGAWLHGFSIPGDPSKLYDGQIFLSAVNMFTSNFNLETSNLLKYQHYLEFSIVGCVFNDSLINVAIWDSGEDPLGQVIDYNEVETFNSSMFNMYAPLYIRELSESTFKHSDFVFDECWSGSAFDLNQVNISRLDINQYTATMRVFVENFAALDGVETSTGFHTPLNFIPTNVRAGNVMTYVDPTTGATINVNMEGYGIIKGFPDVVFDVVNDQDGFTYAPYLTALTHTYITLTTSNEITGGDLDIIITGRLLPADTSEFTRLKSKPTPSAKKQGSKSKYI